MSAELLPLAERIRRERERLAEETALAGPERDLPLRIVPDGPEGTISFVAIITDKGYYADDVYTIYREIVSVNPGSIDPPPERMSELRGWLNEAERIACGNAIPANSPAVETKSGEGEPPTDPYEDLRKLAHDNMKGIQRAVIKALCEAGGELSIAELSIQDGIEWLDATEGFRNAKREILKKLKKYHSEWTLRQHGHCARLVRVNEGSIEG